MSRKKSSNNDIQSPARYNSVKKQDVSVRV